MVSRMMRALAGPENAPQSTNDDSGEEDQIACTGFAWRGQGRVLGLVVHLLGGGHRAGEVPPSRKWWVFAPVKNHPPRH